MTPLSKGFVYVLIDGVWGINFRVHFPEFCCQFNKFSFNQQTLASQTQSHSGYFG